MSQCGILRRGVTGGMLMSIEGGWVAVCRQGGVRVSFALVAVGPIVAFAIHGLSLNSRAGLLRSVFYDFGPERGQRAW